MNSVASSIDTHDTAPFIQSGTASGTKRSVELLKDGRGVYGMVLHAESHSELIGFDAREIEIITRPDRAVMRTPSGGTLFQFVPPAGLFKQSREAEIAELFMRIRYGKHDPDNFDRKRWFGLKTSSRRIVNKHIAESLSVADQDALKMVRRYPAAYREALYHYACENRRFLQLMDTFPVLAMHVCIGDNADIKSMTRSGQPLKDIAAAAGIPMVMRRLKPGSAHITSDLIKTISDHSKLADAYMPDTLHKQRLWFRAITPFVGLRPDCIEWSMRVGLDMSPVVVGTAQVSHDICDWIGASICKDIPDWTKNLLQGSRRLSSRGEEFITREFNANMSFKSVLEASNEWHESVALGGHSGQDLMFDEPWYDGGEIQSHEIIPLASSSDLVKEGARMRHCIRTYVDRVKNGHLYPYTVKAGGKHVATFTIDRGVSNPVLGESRGFANAASPPAALKAIKAWLKQEQKSNGAGRCKPLEAPKYISDDEFIPF